MLRSSELPALAVRRPTLMVVLNLLIIIAGLGALMGVEVRELPDVDRPVVTVRAFFDGASPETMDAEVTSVIETAVARVSGLRTINAASEENNARVRAEFDPSVDLDVAANDVREAVAAIERQLPDGVEDVTVVKADADSRSIIRLAILSDSLSQEALTRVAEDEVATEISAIPGVAAVDLFGEQEQVLRIVVEPLRLASYGASIWTCLRAASSPTTSCCWCAPMRASGGRRISRDSSCARTCVSATWGVPSTAPRRRKATACSMAARWSGLG
jgi:multidrug efflux pump subunit AcrB